MTVTGNQRHLFDIPPGIAYLDCAYLSPLMTEVRTAGVRGVGRKARPWALRRPDFFTEVETVRALFARLIGAAADDVAIVPATSYGMAIAAANLPVAPGQTIVVLAGQHASNYHAWRVLAADRGARLEAVPRPADGDWTGAVLAALGPGTAVAALPNCHWTDGALVDLAAVGARCRELGAALVVDGTQSVGARPLDVAEVQPDFLVCSAYKWLLCPYGLGFLYAAPRHQDGRPLEQHAWHRAGADRHEGKTGYLVEFEPGARRYDVGERSNFIALPMAAAALARILDWGVENIAAALRPLTDDIAARATGIGLAPTPAGRRPAHLLGLRTPGGLPDGLAARLAAADVFVSTRGDAIRVSPHLYNTTADVDRLFAALGRLL